MGERSGESGFSGRLWRRISFASTPSSIASPTSSEVPPPPSLTGLEPFETTSLSAVAPPVLRCSNSSIAANVGSRFRLPSIADSVEASPSFKHDSVIETGGRGVIDELIDSTLASSGVTSSEVISLSPIALVVVWEVGVMTLRNNNEVDNLGLGGVVKVILFRAR